jgi:hypothetical protein
MLPSQLLLMEPSAAAAAVRVELQNSKSTRIASITIFKAKHTAQHLLRRQHAQAGCAVGAGCGSASCCRAA